MTKKLLVADSDAGLCQMCKQFFAAYDYEVEAASDGIDCFKKLRQFNPDILVLDLELNWGGADGVLDYLHEVNPNHQIPVILTSSTRYPKEFATITESPVIACLPKPFALSDLLEHINGAFNRDQQIILPYMNRLIGHPGLVIN